MHTGRLGEGHDGEDITDVDVQRYGECPGPGVGAMGPKSATLTLTVIGTSPIISPGSRTLPSGSRRRPQGSAPSTSIRKAIAASASVANTRGQTRGSLFGARGLG